MEPTVVPELHLAAIRRWCRGRVPPEALSEVRIECDVAGRDVTILECRAPWGPHAGPEWDRFPVARLRYLRSRGVWRLYWRDRGERWHEYPELPFARDVDEVLREIDDDPTALFWG